jgi:hypothetical protein
MDAGTYFRVKSAQGKPKNHSMQTPVLNRRNIQPRLAIAASNAFSKPVILASLLIA